MANVILHIDINSFFASAEQVYNPELRGKELMVAGSNRRAVVAACCYKCKAKGVHAGMPVHKAVKLAPRAIIVPPDFDKYVALSRKFFEYINQNVSEINEVGSIDEIYVDITKKAKTLKSLEQYAKKLIDDVYKELNLPISIGISYCKFLAKMASDMRKPLNYTVITKKNIAQKLWPLDIEKFYGIGNAYATKLRKVNINTIKDLALADKNILKPIFVNQVDSMVAKANGTFIDLISKEHADLKSIGNEHTFDKDITDYESLRDAFIWHAKNIIKRTKIRGVSFQVVTINLKWSEGEVKKWPLKSMQRKLKKPTNDYQKLISTAMDLVLELWDEKPLRHIGLSVSKLRVESDTYNQLDLFGYEKNMGHEGIIAQINDKFGKEVISKGNRADFKAKNKSQMKFIAGDNIKLDIDNLKTKK